MSIRIFTSSQSRQKTRRCSKPTTSASTREPKSDDSRRLIAGASARLGGILVCDVQIERARIDAIALAAGAGAVIEYVPQM